MVELLVFDPALCCSTGVCGPEVDPAVVRFAADLEWIGAQGGHVRRFNLAQEPAAFARNPLVRRTLQQEGTDCLPLVVVGGEIVSRGRYPARRELEGWSGVGPPAAPEERVSRSAAPGGSPGADARGLHGRVSFGASHGRHDGSRGCC